MTLLLAEVSSTDLYLLVGGIVTAAITAYGTYKAATVRTHEDRAATAADRGSVETTAATFQAAIEGLASAADEARREAASARQEAAAARAQAEESREAQKECETARMADQREWTAKYATLEGVVDDLVTRVPGAGASQH